MQRKGNIAHRADGVTRRASGHTACARREYAPASGPAADVHPYRQRPITNPSFGSDTGQLTNNPSTTGSSVGLFNREAFAGITSNAGTLRLGRMTSAVYFASADYISMHNHDTGTSSDALFAFAATGVNNNNTIAYKTPDFAGANVEVAYAFAAGFFPVNPAAFQEQPGSKNQTNLQVAVNWVGGPLHLGGGYALMKDRSGEALTPPVGELKDDMFVIRGLYEIGAFTLGGYYERAKLQVAGDRRTRNNYRLSGMYTMGASEFHLNFGWADDFDGIDDSAATQFTIAYNYNFSKRTKVYAFYTQIDQDDNTNYYLGSANGDKFTSYAIGLRHNF
jgi:predicted porin